PAPSRAPVTAPSPARSRSPGPSRAIEGAMKNTRLLLLWVGMLAVLVACERSGGKQGAATPAGDIPTAAAMPANAAELVTEAPRFMEWLKRDRAAVVHEIAKKEYV